MTESKMHDADEFELGREDGYGQGYADAKAKYACDCQCQFDCRNKQEKVIKEYLRFKKAVEAILE